MKERRDAFLWLVRSICLVCVTALGILAIVATVGCGGGGGGDNGDDDHDNGNGNGVVSVIDTKLTSASVLPTAGGLLAVTSNDDELNGASLDIPARAVSEMTTVSIGTVDSVPSDSPFGQSPIGQLFGLEPSGLQFTEDDTEKEEADKKSVVLTLPISPGEANTDMLYIGRWDRTNKTWEDLGGTIDGNFISTDIDHLSIYGVFYKGKSHVNIVNEADATRADLGIEITYVSGPAIPPDLPDGVDFPAYRPLPAGGVDLDPGETKVMALLPGRYHFLVSYPHPQPGRANSLFFTVPELSDGADDGQIDQTITITMDGATSDDVFTDSSVVFPGYAQVPGSNLRPVAACTATAPPGVVVIDAVQQIPPVFEPQNPQATRIINIGPIKLEELKADPNAIELFSKAHDPEGSDLRYYWTWWNKSRSYDLAASDATVSRFFQPIPNSAGVYTVYVTVYDQYDLFDQCQWNINVIPNTRPTIKAIADDLVIDYGRLDNMRFGGAVPVSGPAACPSLTAPDITIPLNNLCVYLDTDADGIPDTTCLKTLPNVPSPDAYLPTQYPRGMTCVFAIVADADGDNLFGGYKIPEPIFGRGTLYTAITVPNAASGGAQIPLPDGRTVAHVLPGGLPAGSIIYGPNAYDRMAAYNATVSYLANQSLLPVTPPLLGYAPLGPIPAGAQVLPVIWEAPDNPHQKSDQTHDCSHKPVLPDDPHGCLPQGGTVNIQAIVTDGFSPERRNFATVAFPDVSTVFGDLHTISSITPVPADPAPGQNVVVTVVIFPPEAGITVLFTIVGTDGYSNSDTPTTNANGVATFTIPGAAAGVVDVVTVTVGGLSAEVTYVF